ncbi:MAG: hypothetical protein AMXMBFR79_02760 [Chitinophagaceae bacterium]
MKLIITSFFLAVIVGTTLGQTLKTYTGNYKSGNATYQYYENAEYERIFNGNFSYKTNKDNVNVSRAHMPSSIEIKGVYKDNLKEGNWTSKEVITSFIPTHGNVTIIMVLNGTFKNGKREGQWTYKQTFKTIKKEETTTSSLTFSKDILVKTVDFNGIKGNLDNDGNFTSTWNIKKNDIEYIAEFANNVFLKLIKRKVSDGRILFKYDNQNIANTFLSSQSTEKIPKTINGKRYILVSCNKLSEFYNQENEENEDDIYFEEFYKIITNQLNSFDKTLKQISLGSNEAIVKVPEMIFEFKGYTNEEIKKQEEKAKQEENAKYKIEDDPDYLYEEDKVQIKPDFNTSNTWTKFIERNINPQIPIENKAPAGKYIVKVSFIVDKNGSLSNMKVDNDPGFGTKEEVERIINKFPYKSMTQASIHGKNVKCIVRKEVTFYISED